MISRMLNKFIHIFFEGKEMNTKLVVVMTLIGIANLGCQSTSLRGGSVARDEGFRIIVPSTDTQIKQGEIQTVVVSLQRDEYFKRDVKLEIKSSEDISVTPTHMTIKKSDKPDLQLRITADKKAALGEYRVFVKGMPHTGELTSVEFNVKVVAQ